MRQITSLFLAVLLTLGSAWAQQMQQTRQPKLLDFTATSGMRLIVFWDDGHLDLTATNLAGESVTMHVGSDERAIETRFGDATFHHYLDKAGMPDWETARTSEGTFGHLSVYKRQALQAESTEGTVDAPDVGAYTAFARELRRMASETFWSDLVAAEREYASAVLPALTQGEACLGTCAACVLAIVEFSGFWGSVVAACGVTPAGWACLTATLSWVYLRGVPALAICVLCLKCIGEATGLVNTREGTDGDHVPRSSTGG